MLLCTTMSSLSSPTNNVFTELTSAQFTILDENSNCASCTCTSEDEEKKPVPISYDDHVVRSPEIGFTPRTEMNESYPSTNGPDNTRPSPHFAERSEVLQCSTWASSDDLLVEDNTSPHFAERSKVLQCSTWASSDDLLVEDNTSPHFAEQSKVLQCSTWASSGDLLVDSDSRRRLCVVCGDYASGYHYGIASCEACKAFFKRTVQGGIKYTCPARNECEITKKRRKTCQACRYHKCISMGMLIEGVRPNRLRGGRQKYRRKPEETDFGPSPSSKRVKTKKLNELTQLLLSIDTPMVKLENDPSLEGKDPTFRAIKMVADVADKDLIFTVNWAKKIPGFQQLPMNDQMSLLQGSWMEILLIGLLYRSIHLTNPDRLLFTDSLIMSRADSKINGFDTLADRSLFLVRRMRELDIQKEEYVLLKAIALVNADALEVASISGLDQLELKIYDALHEFTQSNYPTTYARREMKLITLLPGFRLLSNESIKHFSKNFIERNVPMRQLFREMIETQTE